jgi:hypothetical protein
MNSAAQETVAISEPTTLPPVGIEVVFCSPAYSPKDDAGVCEKEARNEGFVFEKKKQNPLFSLAVSLCRPGAIV